MHDTFYQEFEYLTQLWRLDFKKNRRSLPSWGSRDVLRHLDQASCDGFLEDST